MTEHKVAVHVYVSRDVKLRMGKHDINWSEYLRSMVARKLELLEKKKQVWCH